MDARTLSSLDWALVTEALSRHARTLRGAEAARRPDFAASPDEVIARYEAVSEVWLLEREGEHIPVGGVGDVRPALEAAVRGEVLEAPDLLAVAASARGLLSLRAFVEARAAEAPRLGALLATVTLDPGLPLRLERSFDAGGALADSAWPLLAEARRRAEAVRNRILRTLEELLRDEAFAANLQDRYVTEREGRYVLPIKASQRKGLGIVHGRSQSGETFYVEPAEVVELTNDLREAEAEIARETRRILAELSRQVAVGAADLAAGLEAAVQVDLAVARAGLGRAIDGVLPRLGEEGVIRLTAARHPVLAIRGVQVISNDFVLDSARPALVLTGPNAGGKTVALKTLGLAALFARAGLPLSAGEDSRVDFFADVLADVGDLQAIQQDLSTFSGHLIALRGVLERARPGALVLVDEIAAGTDPAQGAALARAVLERVVEQGARAAVTTHFGELKALGWSDPRFTVAAMRIEDGRPTYRLERGVAGDSHAFAIAARLGLPEAVLERARALLGPASRAMSDLLEALEAEREQSRRRAEALEEAERRLEARVRAQEAKEAALETREREVRRRMTAEFQERLREREREIKAMIAALQQNPGLRLAGATLDAIRGARAEATLPEPAPPPPPEPVELRPGDKVELRALGQRGVVRKVDGERLEVECGRMVMRVRREEVEPVGQAKTRASRAAPLRVGAARAPAPAPAPERFSTSLRLPSNTCDLRGKRVDEALEEIDTFLSRLAGRGEVVGWILHGHGTGALKVAVRDWLPSSPAVARWRPADADEGGDAYTIVEIR